MNTVCKNRGFVMNDDTHELGSQLRDAHGEAKAVRAALQWLKDPVLKA